MTAPSGAVLPLGTYGDFLVREKRRDHHFHCTERARATYLLHFGGYLGSVPEYMISDV